MIELRKQPRNLPPWTRPVFGLTVDGESIHQVLPAARSLSLAWLVENCLKVPVIVLEWLSQVMDTRKRQKKNECELLENGLPKVISWQNECKYNWERCRFREDLTGFIFNHIERRKTANDLAVGLSDTLNLILLLDSIRVGRSLRSVDDLISEALSDGLGVLEGRGAGSLGDKVNGGVDTTEGGNIDGLTANGTLRSDTGGVLTGASVHDGIAQNLDGVGSGQEVDDLESVTHDTDSHELLTVVTAVHHEGVGHALNNGALSLAEGLLLVTARSVGKILLELGLLVDRDVVL